MGVVAIVSGAQAATHPYEFAATVQAQHTAVVIVFKPRLRYEVLHCASLTAEVATDARTHGDVACHHELLKHPSQAPAPALGLLPMSRSNRDAAAASRRCARQGRHPPHGAAVAVAGDHELDITVTDGA
jgi:hypothetical protein